MKAPRYVDVPLMNGDTARVGAWSVSTPGLIVTEVPAWYGYEITHEESLCRICGPFHQRADAVSAARRLGDTGIMWDMPREMLMMEEASRELIKLAVQEVMDIKWSAIS